MLNPGGNNFLKPVSLTAGWDCLSVDILYLETSENTNVCWTDITREPVWARHDLLSVLRLSTHSFTLLCKIQTFLVAKEN